MNRFFVFFIFVFFSSFSYSQDCEWREWATGPTCDAVTSYWIDRGFPAYCSVLRTDPSTLYQGHYCQGNPCTSPEVWNQDIQACELPEGECVDFVWTTTGDSCGCPPSGDCSGVPNICVFPAVPNWLGECVAPLSDPFPVVAPQEFFDDGYGPVVGPDGDIFEPTDVECSGGVCVAAYSDTGRDVDTSGYPQNGIDYDDTFYGFDSIDENGFPDYENNPFVDPDPFSGDPSDLDNLVPVIPPVVVESDSSTVFGPDGTTVTEISTGISPNGGSNVTETVTHSGNDGNTTVTETSTTTNIDGTTVTVVNNTVTDSEGNVISSSTSGGSSSCVGPACVDDSSDYSGAASGSCDVSPSCDRSEADCQIIVQEWRSMCYVEDYSAGESLYTPTVLDVDLALKDSVASSVSSIQLSTNMAAISSFFTLSLEGSSCPTYDLDAYFFSATLDQWCSPSIPWGLISGLILSVASLSAIRIALG